MEGEKYLSSEDQDAHQTAKVQMSEIRDSSCEAHFQILAEQIQDFQATLRQCLLERVGCHQLFAGTYGYNHSFSYG